MNTDTLHATASTASVARVTRARAQHAAPARRHRLADYIVDVFFVVLLAAPFVIFQSPDSMPDAVGGAHVAAPAVSDSAYGPE